MPKRSLIPAVIALLAGAASAADHPAPAAPRIRPRWGWASSGR